MESRTRGAETQGKLLTTQLGNGEKCLPLEDYESLESITPRSSNLKYSSLREMLCGRSKCFGDEVAGRYQTLTISHKIHRNMLPPPTTLIVPCIFLKTTFNYAVFLITDLVCLCYPSLLYV